MAVDRSEIAFFDLETTIPLRAGQKFMVLEFGAILVCPRKLVELKSFCTLIRPADLSLISESSVKCNGITRSAVATAPKFEEIADRIYDFLDGRVWAGHNIVRFDCVRIREAFAEIGRPPPEAKGLIDSLHLLQQKFGRRAGDMKMATLANYFGLGSQKHRSLDDVRMNLEVLKYCATVLFLESNFPDVLPAATSSTPVKLESPGSSTSKSRRKGKASTETVSEEKGQKPLRRKSKELPLNNEVGILPNNSAKAVNSETEKYPFDIAKAVNSETEKNPFDIAKAVNSETEKNPFDIAKPVNSETEKNPFDMTELCKVLDVEKFRSSSASAQYRKVKQSEYIESEDILEPHERSTFSPVLENKTPGMLPDPSTVVSVSVQHCKAKPSGCTKSENFLEPHEKHENPGISTDPYDVVSVSAQHCKLKQSKCTESEEFLEPRETSTFSTYQNLALLSGPSNVVLVSPNKRCEAKQSECTESEEFLEPREISTFSLRTTFVPSQWGTQKITLLHKDIPFRMHTSNMMIRYGISRKFFDPSGKPRLSFVVEPPSETCSILKECDVLAQNLFSGYNDKSEWRPLLTLKYGLGNDVPTIRMNIATAGSGETATYSTELYLRDSTGTTQRLASQTVDIDKLDELFVSGRLVDADYDFDIYDYQQHAGIRLVARRLTVGC